MHGLFDIGMELVPPDLAVVASAFPRSTNAESAHIARTDVVVTRAILAQISGEEGIELQLAVLLLIIIVWFNMI